MAISFGKPIAAMEGPAYPDNVGVRQEAPFAEVSQQIQAPATSFKPRSFFEGSGDPRRTRFNPHALGPVSDPSFFDQTVGSFAYGAADTFGLLSRAIGAIIPWDNDPFDYIGNSLEGWMKSHPEYAPKEVESAWDLLTSPKALLSRVAFGLPYAVMNIGLMATGPWGLAAATALTAAIETRRGYESAIQDGQSEDVAMQKAWISGTVGTVLNLLPVGKLFRVASGAPTSLVRSLTQKTFNEMEKLELIKWVGKSLTDEQVRKVMVKEGVKYFASQVAIGTLGGTSDDLISLGLYGKPLPKDYWDVAFQHAITAGVSNELMGYAGERIHAKMRGEEPNTPKDIQDIDHKVQASDVMTAGQLFDKIKYAAGDDKELVGQLVSVAQQMIKTRSKETGESYAVSLQKIFATGQDIRTRFTAEEVKTSIGKVQGALKNVDRTAVAARELRDKLLTSSETNPITTQDLVMAGVEEMLNTTGAVDVPKLLGTMEARALDVGEAFHGKDKRRAGLTTLTLAREQQQQLVDQLGKLKTDDPASKSLAEALTARLDQASEVYTNTFNELFTNPDQERATREGVKTYFVESATKPGSADKQIIRLDYTEKDQPHLGGNNKDFVVESLTGVVKTKATLDPTGVETDAAASQADYKAGKTPTPEAKSSRGKNARDRAQTGASIRQAFLAAIDNGAEYVSVREDIDGGALSKLFANEVRRLDKDAMATGHEADGRKYYRFHLTEKLRTNLFKKLSKDTVSAHKDSLRIIDHGMSVLDAFRGNPTRTMETLFQTFKNYLNPEQARTLEQFSGVETPGKWKTENERKAFHAWLNYMRGGKSPSTELGGIFSYFEKYLKATYTGVRMKVKFGADMQSDLKAVFDQMLYKDKAPITAARLGVKAAEEEERKTFQEMSLAKIRLDHAAQGGAKSGTKSGTAEPSVTKPPVTEPAPAATPVDQPHPSGERIGEPVRDPAKILAMEPDPSGFDPNKPSEEIVVAYEGNGVRVQQQNVEPGGGATKPEDPKASASKPAAPGATPEAEPAKPEPAKPPPTKAELDEKYKDALKRYEQAKSAGDTARADLQRLQATDYTPGVPTESQRLAETVAELHKDVETPKTSFFRRQLSSIVNSVQQWIVSKADVLRKTVGGSKFIHDLDLSMNAKREFAGEFEMERLAIMNQLSSKEMQLLASDLGDGWSLHRVLTDPGAIPETVGIRDVQLTPALEAYRDLHAKIWRRATELGIELRVVRQLPDGSWQPIRLSDQRSSPRSMTEVGYQVVRQQAGVQYTALIDTLIRHNPGMSREAIVSWVDRTYGLSSIKNRDLGALEHHRGVRYFPDFIQTPDGKSFQMFHSEPEVATTKAIDRYGMRLGQIKYFGQGVLSTVNTNQLLELFQGIGAVESKKQQEHQREVRAKYREVSNALKELPIGADAEARNKLVDELARLKDEEAKEFPKFELSEFGQFLQRELQLHVQKDGRLSMYRDKEFLIRLIKDAVGDDADPEFTASLFEMSPERLTKTIKEMQIEGDAEVPMGELIGALEKFDPSSLTDAQVKSLQKFARDIGGVSLSIPNPLKGMYREMGAENTVDAEALASAIKADKLQLWGETVQRVRDNYDFFIVDQLRKHHVAGGGDGELFNKVWAMAQGIPLWEHKQTPLHKTARFVSSLIGSLQTSMAVVPNMTQTAQLAQFVPLKNMLEAWRSTMMHEPAVHQTLIEMGAFRDAVLHWVYEPGALLDEAGRLLRQGASTLTLQSRMANLNHLISGQAFYNYGMELANPKNLTKHAINTLKRFGFDAKEIARIQAEGLKGDDFKRFVREGIAKTQFTTDAPWHKALIEDVPLAKTLFAYMSYATGTMRNNIDFAVRLFKDRDMGSLRRATGLIAGTLGAGITSMILRQAVKGDFRQFKKDEEEGLTNLATGAFVESGLLGPVQRMVTPLNMDNGQTEAGLVRMMPQVSALVDVFNAAIGRGKFGDFEPGRRLSESLFKNTPAAKVFRDWFDRVAYPEFVQYQVTRQASAKFEVGLTKDEKRNISAQYNPDYHIIYEFTARNDMEAAKEERDLLIKRKIEEGENPLKVLEGLRASLMSRAPVSLSLKNTWAFYRSLSPAEREKHQAVQRRYLGIVNRIAPRRNPYY
jgi:hypothetical protein